MTQPIPTLDIDAAIHAIRVRQREDGPRPPENPLGRLISDTPDAVQLPSRKAALARMRTARIVLLKRIFDRRHLND